MHRAQQLLALIKKGEADNSQAVTASSAARSQGRGGAGWEPARCLGSRNGTGTCQETQLCACPQRAHATSSVTSARGYLCI